MVHLYKITNTDFMAFHVDETVENAIQSVQNQNPTAIVVYRNRKYYLYLKDDFLHQLSGVNQNRSLQKALGLGMFSYPTPALDMYDDAADAPNQCVVLRSGNVAGFYDVSIRPSEHNRLDGVDGKSRS